MAHYLIQDTTLTAIANAIREKMNLTAPMTPSQMVDALLGSGTTSGYTNLVPTATTADGGTIIFNNGLGYKDGTYISSNNSNPATSESPVTSTGFIALPVYDASSLFTIYVKGISLDYSSTSPYSRCRCYFNRGTNTTQYDLFTDSNNFYDVVKISENYYSITPNSYCFNNYGVFTSFRISGVGYGENLIITINEPIE